MIDPETLRKVAEEVRSAFPRPLVGPELVLIDVDPQHLHAFWSVSPALVQTARQDLGSEGGDAPMVLRLYEMPSAGEPPGAFDVEVVGLQGHCYVDIWAETRRYRGELGLRRLDGSLVALATSNIVELPRSEPAAESRPAQQAIQIPQPPGEEAEAAVPTRSTAEPVRHPFPLPPSEPSQFDPEHLVPPAPTPEVGAERAAGPEMVAPILSVERAEALGSKIGEGREPAHHPFPPPPSKPSPFDPHALIGGFLPPTSELGSETLPSAGEDEVRQAKQAEHSPFAEAPQSGPAPGQEGAPPLPLENVLTLSSYALGRDRVEFEINAELRIFGRARPGAQLQLFGRKVPLLPDGTFSITRPLPDGALVLSSLLEGDDEPGEP